MGSTVLKDTYLKVENLKYYRSNGIQLGDVGTKKTSVFSVNRVDTQNNIPAPKIKVRRGNAISVNSAFASAAASLFLYPGLTAASLESQLKRGKLVVARYYIKDQDMINGIENSPKLIGTIRNIGKAARVVSDVWVVATADFFEATGKGSFNFTPTSAEASLSAGGTKISLSPGTVLAYMLHKIDWEEKQKKNWSNIDNMIQDPKGL